MLDGFVYAIGGWDGNFRWDSVEYYNILTNLFAGLVILDRFMYAIGGWEGNVRLDREEYYNM